MPRKGRKGRGNGASDSVVFPFHNVLSGTLTAGTVAILVSPNSNMSPRALLEADVWAHFRVKKLAFRIWRTSAVTNPQAIGFVGGVEDTAPSTVVQIMELMPSTYIQETNTVPSNWVHVPRIDLRGPFPWYKTIPGTADATEEAPGYVCVAGSGTDAYRVEFKGAFEFKTSVNSANTPLSVELRARIREERRQIVIARERKALLGVIAPAAAQVKSTP